MRVAVSEIFTPQSVNHTGTSIDKSMAHRQAHVGQMGNWSWRCKITDIYIFTELWTEKNRPVVSEPSAKSGAAARLATRSSTRAGRAEG